MNNLLIFLLLIIFNYNGVSQTVDIDKYIQKYMDKNNSTGTILIKKDGQIVYQNSFGMANLQFEIPNSNVTKYKIASITKVFTAVLILQLFEEKKLDLNSPISEYLSDYTGEGSNVVTIHHLLTHTSGIENVEKFPLKGFKKPWFDIYQKPYSTDDIIQTFCSGPLVNVPGVKFDYNNGDYMILGKILERISNMTFEEILQKQILIPLKMENTGMFYQANVIKNMSNTYVWNDSTGKFENDRPAYIENWYASAAMYSTCNDLLKFSDALFNNTILTQESLNLIITPVLSNYGYGTWIRDVEINGKQHKILQRYGRIRGANTVWFRFIDQDLTIIILSNTDTTNMNDFAHGIARRLNK